MAKKVKAIFLFDTQAPKEKAKANFANTIERGYWPQKYP